MGVFCIDVLILIEYKTTVLRPDASTSTLETIERRSGLPHD